MYIGEVARRTGLSIKAIRLYEERGLIVPPQRHGRYRVYRESDVEILNLISEAKTLGATLAQLKSVIVYRGDEVDWSKIALFLAELKAKLEVQRQRLDDQINQIERCLNSINSCPDA